ncbi:hypothetical protein [Bacillus sp. JCM 19034]|nr:hypothetical protein [Bacillus sp. JCM 19034]
MSYFISIINAVVNSLQPECLGNGRMNESVTVGVGLEIMRN